MSNKLVSSEEYLSFRNAVPLKRIIVDEGDSKVWSLYDAGPRSVKCPLVCLPPAAGKADIFFRQVLGLSGTGYRVIALDYPVYWTIEEFCVGLRKVVDHLRLDRIHIFGCSLGGYLAMKFAERMRNTQYVASMVICNGFTDTSVFKYTRSSSAFWLVPSFILKRMVMSSFSQAITDAQQADATDFIVECLENLSQKEISSRLVLHCNGDYLRCPHSLQALPVTVMDVFDESVLSQSVKDDVYKCFPGAKPAHLKTGGNFPYLSRSAEVNMHLRIHLRQFEGGGSTARHVLLEEAEESGSLQSYEAQTLEGVSRQSSIVDEEYQHNDDEMLSGATQDKRKEEVHCIIDRDTDDANDFPI